MTDFKIDYSGKSISPCNFFLTMSSADAWITHDPLVPFQDIGTVAPPNFYGVQLSYTIRKVPPSLPGWKLVTNWFQGNFAYQAFKDGKLSECNGTMFIDGEAVLDFKLEVETAPSKLRPAQLPSSGDLTTSKRTLLEARGSRKHGFDPSVTTDIRASNSSEVVKDKPADFLMNVNFFGGFPAANPDVPMDASFGGHIGGTSAELWYKPTPRNASSTEDWLLGRDVVESVVDLMEWECAQPKFVYATADIVKNGQPSAGHMVVQPYKGEY